MQVPLITEHTQTITVNDVVIPVSSLPSDLRYEIATLDAYTQEHRTALFEIEKLNLLLDTKKNQLQKLLSAYFENLNHVETPGAASKQDTAPDRA